MDHEPTSGMAVSTLFGETQYGHACNRCFMLAQGRPSPERDAIRAWGQHPDVSRLSVADQKKGYRLTCEYCGSEDHNVLYKFALHRRKK